MAIQNNKITEAKVWIIGLRLDAEDVSPTYYTLVAGEDQQPVVVNEQLVFYSDPDLLEDAAQLAGIRRPIDEKESSQPDLICDLAEALYLIENGDEDDSATIVNCLNTLFDLVFATKGSIPTAYRQKLFNFADHLTFSRSLSAAFRESNELRSDIIDGVLWCAGWVITHARILHRHAAPS